MATLYDLILSATYNIRMNGNIGLMVGKMQLVDIESELEKGTGLHDEIEDGDSNA